jgi:salicylate hydroxylase
VEQGVLIYTTSRITKLLHLSDTADKWKLCIRQELEQWSHPSGTFTLLGDAVHATLPYMASGAAMCIEDGAVLGECFSRISSTSSVDIKNALAVYEKCRKDRTERIVQRSTLQQHLAHLHDGEEQEERDRKMRMIPTPVGEAFVWRDPEIGPWLLGYDHVEDVSICSPQYTL